MQSQLKIKLKKFDHTFLDKTFDWIQDSGLRKDFLFTANIDIQSHKKWYKSYIDDQTQTIFAIMVNENHVGNIGLKFIDLNNNNAETWIYIGDSSYKGRGVAYKSYQELFNKISHLKLNKIYAHVADFNLNSLKLYEKIGFELEGTLKKQVKINDRYIDLIRLAIFL
tara:strand:- start:1070 stop:1570 length:501 start_codon:yes stop_codon:yes gene_type:complete